MNAKLTTQEIGVLASHLAWVQKYQPALFKAFVSKLVEAAKAHGLLPKSMITTLTPTELIGLIVALSDVGVSLQSQAQGGVSGLGQSSGSASTAGDIFSGVGSFLQSLATTYVGTRAAINTMNAQNNALASGYPAYNVNANGQPSSGVGMLSSVSSMSPMLIIGIVGVVAVGAVVVMKKKRRK